MIPPEKPDIIYLLNTAGSAYAPYNVRIVNMEGKEDTDRLSINSINQIKDARLTKLDIHNVGFNIENEDAIIDMIRNRKILNFPTQIIRIQSTNFPFRGFIASGGSMQSITSYSNIKAMFITFDMNLYPTWFFPDLFQRFNLEIDQRHLIQQDYVSLNPTVTSQMFECFVEQDLVSAPSDLYCSLNFQNQTINEGRGDYYGHMGNNFQERENIVNNIMLYSGSKVVQIYYPYKFILVLMMAPDDSFSIGYNESKMCARTNIQVNLSGTLTEGIVGNELIKVNVNESHNHRISFIATRSFPTPTYAQITHQMHHLYYAVIRFTFDDAPDPQVLNFEIIGEVSGTMIRSG
ncbi:MAG: hypothetical protein EZS28_002530 [Streblomastix strix]|uniref:Uncharacterized protein n=1 Tax=Streblomastix strix TaxID=222440 RepID=A0A5J4X3U1_9EUKA|nr:MAG: hypothetical protein EZS28_002530 [Streblomastix strix]